MHIKKFYIACIIFVLLPLCWVLHSGCAKEYSYEGGDTVVVRDTIVSGGPGNPSGPWTCPACIGQDQQIESRWSFHDGDFFTCGMIDTAIVNPERTAFTFFGPYGCSRDTGIIIDAFLGSAVLNKDVHNITSKEGAFYYYDNIGPSFILISHVANFTVKIESYIQQTHLATGTFSGTAYKPDGTPITVSSGKFKVRLY